jgi:carbon storage regulator
MLVLSRKLNETVYVGDDIVIKVVKIKGNVVGLGIEAPASVKVMRSELLAQDKNPLPKESAPNAKSDTSRKTGPLGVFTIAG